MDARSFIVAAVLVSVSASGCFSSHSVGSAADHFLNGTTHPRMVVEIDQQPGKELRSDTIALLKQRLGERLNKPGGITYQQEPVALSSHTWTLEDLRNAEQAHRDSHDVVGQASMYILVVGGGYQQDSNDAKVLGLAFGPSSLAIFKDNIEGTSPGPLPVFSTSDVEHAVIVHEAGHLLGLVNLGTKMVRPHEDPDHPGHSNDKNSVMYYAVESSILSQVLSGPPPTQFDNDDIADLQAAGGK